MNVSRNFLSLPLLISLLALAGAYVAWQLIGLRFTNHDDIAIHLRSWITAGEYIQSAKITALSQARLQSFITMPTYLWSSKFADSRFYDAYNIGSFLAMYAGFAWLLALLTSKRHAVAITAATLFLFPLHYYFTFPQGYAVLGSCFPALAFFAAGFLSSYIQNGKTWRLTCSAVLFTFSLLGSEFNFVLHPAFLIVIAISATGWNLKRLFRMLWPHVTGFTAVAVSYAAFSLFARERGGDTIGRLTVGLDFSNWLNTFLLLQEKAFLPFALWRGIELETASPQGVPVSPSTLTFSSLLSESQDKLTIALILVLAAIAFAAMLRLPKLPAKSLLVIAIILLFTATLPTVVLSLSSHYHEVVLAGQLQGHLASTYTDIGLAGLLFLLMFSAVNKVSQHSCTKHFLIAFFSIILGILATSTFVYNNANRQIMSANKQKWDAVHELCKHADLISSGNQIRPIIAPAFWTRSGVSAIPTVARTTGENYWTEFARTICGTQLSIVAANQVSERKIWLASYVSTPQGTPVVLLSTPDTNNHSLIASNPVSGTIIYSADATRNRHVSAEDWICNTQCVFRWTDSIDIPTESIDFEPDDLGTTNLLKQFFLDRGGQYAYPFHWRSKLSPPRLLNDLQIVNWGPRQANFRASVNGQVDKQSAIWIQTPTARDFGELRVIFNGEFAAETKFAPGVITAAVPDRVLRSVGVKSIHIEQVETRARILVGNLNVIEK